MPRGVKTPIEERIRKKEELIASLQVRIKSEQKELDALYNEKKVSDLENISELIRGSGLSEDEVTEALSRYISEKNQGVS